MHSLPDRVVIRDVEWIEPALLEHFRTWAGIDNESWLDLHKARDRARKMGLKVYGHFDGEPGALEAQQFRAALLLFAEEQGERHAAVVIARDMDGQEDRRQGFKQAVESYTWPFVVIGALASPEIEAWLVAAWAPESVNDQAALEQVKERVHFKPTTSPERLTSKKQTDKGDAKRVLGELCAHGRTAEERWEGTNIERLRAVGANCGLGTFIAEAETRIVPLLSGQPEGHREE